MSLTVAACAMAIAGYLAWNPRGMPRNEGGRFRDSSTSYPDTQTFDPVPVISDADTPTVRRARFDSTRVRDHLARLREMDLAITGDELRATGSNTLREALMLLRPYWLEAELQAAVRVGGQLVGGITALEDVALASADIVRLEFSPTEPHWIIQIFMR